MRDRTSITKTLRDAEAWEFFKNVRSLSGCFSCDLDGTIKITNVELEFKQ